MKKRTVIYLGVFLLVVFGGIMGKDIVSGLLGLEYSFSPVLPVIQLPGEVIFAWPGGTDFLGGLFGGGFTNTFFATILTFIIIFFFFFALKPKSRTADEIPTGIYNFFEMIIEGAYGYVEQSAGKWTRNFFPFFMTFILWIVVANWMELVPFVDSLGKWEEIPVLRGEQAEKAILDAGGTHDEAELAKEDATVASELKREGDLRRGEIFLMRTRVDENGEKPEDAKWTIVPYVRAAATDLNFTLALAIISVFMTQYYGMKAQGMKYWTKFFVWDGDAIAKNPLAIMDSGVGLLEFISELFKIVSFAFRLLGNIFAGAVLLFVIGSLLPVANIVFWHLEFGVGILQAVVFALLTLTFMAGATQGHGHDDAH